jgi:hypothetical protein
MSEPYKYLNFGQYPLNLWFRVGNSETLSHKGFTQSKNVSEESILAMYTQVIYNYPGGRTILNDQIRMPHGTETIQNIINSFQGAECRFLGCDAVYFLCGCHVEGASAAHPS